MARVGGPVRGRAFAALAEGFRAIAVTRPRLDRDWVYSVDSSGWLTSEPLKGADWATNVAGRPAAPFGGQRVCW